MFACFSLFVRATACSGPPHVVIFLVHVNRVAQDFKLQLWIDHPDLFLSIAH